jgi:hypothetical protein
MRRILVLLLLAATIGAFQVYAQEKVKTAAKIEPLRVASGLMMGNQILIRRTDWINEGKPLFTYTLRSVRVIEGKLEFSGALQRPGVRSPQEVASTLITTTARSANPWPSAASPSGRDRNRKPANQNAPEQERNEQTQSLHSAAEAGLGCELIFLKLTPPTGATALQVGVVLAHQDNERGVDINREICTIVRGMKSGETVTASLARLNQLLAEK